MPRRDAFAGLTEFLAVARQGSFRKAAHELAVTAGAVSQAIQSLEAQLRSPLFNRTTRSVALTEAGELLLARIGPAAGQIRDTLDELLQMGAHPSGTLRLLVQRFALSHIVEPVLPDFCRDYPDVQVEIAVEDELNELVSRSYDAGLRIGEYIDADMVATRVSAPFRWQVFGAPGYFREHGRPERPEDLSGHACIRYRRPHVGDVYRWEFERDGQALTIDPPGSILINDAGLLRSLGKQGLGLIYTADLNVRQELAEGSLQPVLEAYAPAQDSIFLYFPRASRNQPKLRAFAQACTRRLTANRSSDGGRVHA